MKNFHTINWMTGKLDIASLFLLFLTPFVCVAENPTSSTRQPVKPTVQSRTDSRPHWKVSKKKVLKPQYESCQNVDISSLSLKEKSKKKTVAEFCFTCFFTKNYGFEEVKEAASAAQSKVFREKLQKRVIGQIESKVFQTEMLRACVTGNRNYFSQKKVDWPLMKEACKNHTKKLKSAIKTRWPEMRTNLVLSQVNADQIVTGNPNLSFPLSHSVSDFSPISKLTEKEKKAVKARWANILSEASLDKVTSSDVKSKFLEGQPLKDLSTKDQGQLRRATWDMQKKAKDSYSEIMGEMPVLGYLKNGNPNKKELGEALLKKEEKLRDFLKKAKDPEADMGLFLSFKTLVEELLRENNGYCLVAEKARIKAENDKSLENWGMLGLGVLAAVPCFITGPIGATACLTAGMALGFVGYKHAQVGKEEALGRVLTGKEFETFAGLSEKEKEEFLAKIFLPLGAWGTTAVPARAASGAITRAVKGSKVRTKTGSRKGAGIQTDPTDAKAVLSMKSHINPEDVHIAKTGHNADTNSDIFQVKFTSSNGKETQFELEISKERLEQNKLDIEKEIKEVAEFEELDAAETAEYVAFARKKDDLLLNMQKFISQMSEESFQGRNRISLEELESMLISQYKNKVFQHIAQNYGRQPHSKLSQIGTENVHIKKTSHDAGFKEYNVQFRTRKGKQMSLKLEISEAADENISNDFVLDRIKENEIDSQVLTMEQKMQLAIGQMPAEVFKGLKLIAIQSPNGTGGYAGQVRPHLPGILKKWKGKYALNNLPPHLAVRLPINESVVHAWMKVTKSTKSEMNLAVNQLKDIPLSSEYDLSSTLAHELGHVLQNTQYSLVTMSKVTKSTSFEDMSKQVEKMKNPKGWPDAIKKDGTSVSDYGDTKLSEDFAEAMRVYIQTDGGTKNPQALKDFANRFEILDNLMQASMAERKSLFDKFKKAMAKKGVAFVVTSGGNLSHIIVQDQVHIIHPSEDISTPNE